MCAAEVDAHVAQRYLLKRRLGKGAYGVVWKAVDRRTGEVVAIKKIFDAFRDKTDAQRTFREVVLLQEFGDHPNIVRLLDVIRAENDRDIYLVFEFMDADLNAVIRKGGLLGDAHQRFIFYQLLQATRFMHSGHVIHRDQKPSNVLLDANCLVKLCDFGLARTLGSLPTGPEGQALTEYVATRWYRAPEVLLSSPRYSAMPLIPLLPAGPLGRPSYPAGVPQPSTYPQPPVCPDLAFKHLPSTSASELPLAHPFLPRYTPGVDMWSLGCILGEMLRGRPLFPGTSTLHQLELILETIPLPSEEDLESLGSGYGTALLYQLASGPQQTLDTLLPPETPPDALDLLRRLLVFAPHKRLSAAQALQHPYVQRFHCPGREWTRHVEVRLPVLDGNQLSAPEYRSLLYQMILDRRGNSHRPRDGGLRSAAWGPEPRASRARGHLSNPRAIPQLGFRVPVRNPGPRPRSSPDRDPEHETSGAPQLQPLPPGRGKRSPRAKAEPSCTPPGVNASLRGMAPSLTLQAAAQATNQALFRSDRVWNSGLRAAGGRQLSPRGPRDVPEPRPGRRMFGTSALQGAQGAARAALGGYSQAYGTVCRSALGRLPLLPGPRA